VAIQRRTLGDDHPNTLEVLDSQAEVFRRENKFAQAETVWSKVLDVRRRVLGPEHPDTTMTLTSLGKVLLQRKAYAESMATLRDALRLYEKIKPGGWQRYNCESALGASLAGLKHYADAETLLVSGYEGMRLRSANIPAASRPGVGEAAGWLVQLYRDWGKPEKATEWSQKLKDANPRVSLKAQRE
jgi:eukaryotic-like serine/threonine-protein kinase